MPDLKNLNSSERREYENELKKQYQTLHSRNLNIDMTRGKPCPEQLDISLDMLDCGTASDYMTANGVDGRNYGGIDGIPEAKELFSQLLEVEPHEIIIGGNASLNLMHDTILRAMVFGVVDSDVGWGKLPKIKFLCPSPGYDRHFSVCEFMGIEMIDVEMTPDGPDMDQVEKLVSEDDAIKGMWCVPKYSNPSGAVYSDEVVERLASMRTKAKDFRLFWDNAYAVHHLIDNPKKLKNILAACKEAGNPERPFIFGSTSKITFAGAGLAMMGGSEKNIEFIKQQIFYQTIGPDKLNQLRHVRFLKDMDGIENHMKKHAAILKPKFDAVETILSKELAGKGVAEWSRPEGGYFVSINTRDGCAKKVVEMAGELGVKLTPAGATYPYKKDPRDRNFRIAPSFPSPDEISAAMGVVAVCIQLAALEKM
ncbi:MAG: aminotransferase class I/II-fold pyridoxal phosphate-dependent enzyme [Deltaproteobacteria bacterium]|nr:aminotransferase class I/II-fold pyridoxal phosphate-dependent enzyme [Deltaproteobacteria bacterium]